MFISPMCAVPLGLKDGRTVWEQRHNSMIWECEKYFIEIRPKFHLTVKPADWWAGKLAAFWHAIQKTEDTGSVFIFVARGAKHD